MDEVKVSPQNETSGVDPCRMSLTQSGIILLVNLIDSTNNNSPHNTPENVPLVSLSLRYYFVSAEYLFALVLVLAGLSVAPGRIGHVRALETLIGHAH